MRRTFIAAALWAFAFMPMMASVDPNFYIYLCFGQSNMEGNAQWESVDTQNVDERFQMLATTNFSSPVRHMGEWYVAKPPIVSPQGKLGMADYFGRTMVAALPAEVRVGVVDVAIGGCAIQMFDKDQYQTQMTDPSNWSTILANQYYGGNPYKRLIDMAKIAQQSGVIKGILLHQGESNNGDPNWPQMVKKIYNDILTDLELNAEDVPLFAGETLHQENGGACWGHNNVLANLPNVIPTAHVIHADGCPGNGVDPWHFSAQGYRTMGKRYAYEVLRVMGHPTVMDANYQMPANLRKFYALKNLDQETLTMRVGGNKRLKLWGTFEDNHREDLTAEAAFSSNDYSIVNGILTVGAEGTGFYTASYTDFIGTVHNADITVEVSDEGPNHVLLFDNGAAGANIWDRQGIYTLPTPMVKGKTYVVKASVLAENGGDVALWPIWSTSPNRDQWGNSADVQYLSSYHVGKTFTDLTWTFSASHDHDKLQFVFGKIGGKVYFDNVSCKDRDTGVEMVINGDFESDDLTGWSVNWSGPTMTWMEYNDPSGITERVAAGKNGKIYNLNGCLVSRPQKGVYIVDGKKVVIARQ